MSQLKKVFVRGIMDKESSPAYVKQGLTRHAENLRFQTNEGHDGEGKKHQRNYQNK